MDAVWLKESLFAGMTANAFKLGTVLTLGWFWTRVTGCSMLYRGGSMETIEFADILTVAEARTSSIGPPSYVPHDGDSTYFYVVRRANNCGQQERTLAAAVKVAIDANGDLVQPQPNSIFVVRVKQVDGSKVQLVWFYCPLEQQSQPTCFKVYYDAGTGQIDYENPLATVNFEGRTFYSYKSDTFDAGRYLFAVKAEDMEGTQSSSSSQQMIHVVTASPDPIDILSAEAI